MTPQQMSSWCESVTHHLVFSGGNFATHTDNPFLSFFTVTVGEKARCTFSTNLRLPQMSWLLHAPLGKCLLAHVPSDTDVYNALVYDQRLTLEPRSHVVHLHLLQVEGALRGGFSPHGGLTAAGLTAVGLLQTGAATRGVNS